MRFNAGASATYKRLADNSWGVWTDRECRPGQTITVTAANGNTKLEKLDSILWTNGKLWLWRVKPK